DRPASWLARPWRRSDAPCHRPFRERSRFLPKERLQTELAWTLYDYANALLDTGSRGDRERAATLLHEGHDLASQHGMRTLNAVIAAFPQRYGLRLALTTRG